MSRDTFRKYQIKTYMRTSKSGSKWVIRVLDFFDNLVFKTESRNRNEAKKEAQEFRRKYREQEKLKKAEIREEHRGMGWIGELILPPKHAFSMLFSFA